MTTDTSERGLERLICAALTGSPCEPGAASGGTVRERGRSTAAPAGSARAGRLRPRALRRFGAADVGLFVNGLPVVTFELKNSLTKQTVNDAVQQYRRDRDPRERLFALGRCAVHFAVDEHEVRFCTHLQGKGSWFLPFNRGWNDGAGNPIEERVHRRRARALHAGRELLPAGQDGRRRPAVRRQAGREEAAALRRRARARRPDRQNARIEHDKALRRVMTAVLKDDTELFRQFSDNDDFRAGSPKRCSH